MFGLSFEEKAKDAARDLSKSLGIPDLRASVDDKVVTLTGTVPDLATKTRVMVEFNKRIETENTINRLTLEAHPASTTAGNHQVGPPLPPMGTPITRSQGPISGTARVHEVVKGDTLSGIAKKYYGKSSEYPRIFEANKDVLKDPDKIFPGQKLRIPDAPGAPHHA